MPSPEQPRSSELADSLEKPRRVSQERVRQLGTRLWKPILSLASSALVVINSVKAAGWSIPGLPGIGSTAGQIWSLIAFGVIVFLAIRFPQVGFTINRWILGPPPAPRTKGMIFRGPVAYGSDDLLPGRRGETDRCWISIQRVRFFILEGESGCGKSSLLSARLIPLARKEFTVIECRIADNPFGKLYSSLRGELYSSETRVSSEALAQAISERAKGVDNRGNRIVNPLLVCIDQFEELFATVKDDTRTSFVNILKEAIKRGELRLLVALRSNCFDLLKEVRDRVDPACETLDLSNYFKLEALRKHEAEALLREMLEPIHANSAMLEQQHEEFTRALVRELLRPPRDKRKCEEDEKTVLPVELQTVGMLLESYGIVNFSASALKRKGGKIGLLRAFIEDAKTYVSRKTAVSAHLALIILRELIPPAQTKWSLTPESIAVALDLPLTKVQRVLDAFAEKYLVNRVPQAPEESDRKNEPPTVRYELMHEHLAEILLEAPDPILQKARDAEQRLRFWSERTRGTHKAIESGKMRYAVGLIPRLLAEPLTLFESLALWRFARSEEQRRMLLRGVLGFTLRILVGAMLIALLFAGSTLWTRTDTYQIRTILHSPPVSEAASSGDAGSRVVIEWARALACAHQEKEALNVARKLSAPEKMLLAFVATFEGCYQSGYLAEAKGAIDEGLAAAREIEDESARYNGLRGAGDVLADAGYINEAADVIHETMIVAREFKKHDLRCDALVGVVEAQVKIGKIGESRKPLDEALDAARNVKVDEYRVLTGVPGEWGLSEAAAGFGHETNATYSRYSALSRVVEGLIRVGRLDDAKTVTMQEISKAPFRSRALLRIVESLANAGRVDEALDLVRGITDTSLRSTALSAVAEGLVRIGRVREGFIRAGQIKERASRAHVYANVAVILINAGRTNDAKRALYATMTLAKNREYDQSLGPALAAIVDGLVQTELYGEVEVEARKIKFEDVRYRALTAIGVGLAKAGRIDDAIRIAKEVKDSFDCYEIFADLASRIIKAGRAGDALSAIHEIKSDYLRYQAFTSAAEALVSVGKIDDALSSVREIKQEDFRYRAYRAFAKALVLVGTDDDTSRFLNEILADANKRKQDTSVNAARGVDHNQILTDANERKQKHNEISYTATNESEQDESLYQAFASVAEELVKRGRDGEVLAAARNVKSDNLRSRTLSAITKDLVDVGRADDAVVVAREITQDDLRSRTWAIIAKGYAQTQSYKSARITADLCSVSRDKLDAYVSILLEYTKERNANLRAQVAPNRKEQPTRNTN